MSAVDFEIMAIAVTVAVACALPGVFLVLRRTALLSDAISHTVLLGIVAAFFLVQDITSPFLVIGAAATGVLTVALVEALRSTGLLREDAAIGLVFPVLFSVAVIVISRYGGNVHLDTDAVLLGELALSPFRRLEIGGVDLGPRTLWLMLGILTIDAAFMAAFFKELKLSTFDPALAAALGISPIVVHYGFMSLVSLTAVGAFDAVGSILVVAFMIAPPAAAYLISDRLSRVICLSALIGAGSVVAGYAVARVLDVSIAGTMAGMTGVAFLGALLLAPDRGLVAMALRRSRQKIEFAESMLTIHLLNHRGGPDAPQECHVDHLHDHLRWRPERVREIVRSSQRSRLITVEDTGRMRLTPAGEERARRALTY